MNETTQTDPQPISAVDDDERHLALTIVHHPNVELVGAREIVSTGQKMLLGRSERSAFVGALDAARISREHTLVTARADALEVVDQKSRNGTFVNGEAVERARVREGDVLGLGDVLLLVQQGAAHVSPRGRGRR